MTSFYLYAIALVAFACLFVVLPLLQAKRQNLMELSNANVVKQRISELEQEVSEGLISEQDKEQAIKELKIALVDETPEDAVLLSKDESLDAPRKVNLLKFALLALPAIAIGIWVYWQSNQISGLTEYTQTRVEVGKLQEQMREQGAQSLSPNDFAKLALAIRASLRETPDDARAWGYLGLINSAIGRSEEGVQAYLKALDIEPQDDQIRFQYAEALMLTGDEDSLNESKRQLLYLLQKSPDNRDYRLLLTTVGLQLSDTELAYQSFMSVKEQLNPNSQYFQSIVQRFKELGIDIPVSSASPLVGTGNGTATEEGSESPSIVSSRQNTSDESVNDDMVAVNVVVDISDSLRSKLPEQAYLIVFAQNQDGSSRAPLAVKRIALPDLPYSLQLSDQDAMIPNMNLSSATSVKLTARVSIDADVMTKAGELEGVIENIDVNSLSEKPLRVLINKEL